MDQRDVVQQKRALLAFLQVVDVDILTAQLLLVAVAKVVIKSVAATLRTVVVRKYVKVQVMAVMLDRVNAISLSLGSSPIQPRDLHVAIRGNQNFAPRLKRRAT